MSASAKAVAKLPLFVNDNPVDFAEVDLTCLDVDDMDVEIPPPSDSCFAEVFNEIAYIPSIEMIVDEPSFSFANNVTESSQPVAPFVDDIVLSALRQPALMIGENIKSIVTNSVRDQLPQIAGKLGDLFGAIERLGFDPSLLKREVEGYLLEASGMSASYADQIGKITFELKSQKIAEAVKDAKAISDALAEGRDVFDSNKESIAGLRQKEVNLVNELEIVRCKLGELQSASSDIELSLQGHQHKLEEAKKKCAIAENLPSLSATDVEELKAREKKFEAMRETLRNFELSF